MWTGVFQSRAKNACTRTSLSNSSHPRLTLTRTPAGRSPTGFGAFERRMHKNFIETASVTRGCWTNVYVMKALHVPREITTPPIPFVSLSVRCPLSEFYISYSAIFFFRFFFFFFWPFVDPAKVPEGWKWTVSRVRTALPSPPPSLFSLGYVSKYFGNWYFEFNRVVVCFSAWRFLVARFHARNKTRD